MINSEMSIVQFFPRSVQHISIRTFVNAILKAAVLSLAMIIVINFGGALTPSQRLVAVVAEANDKQQLDQRQNWNNDMFTECAMFYMEMIRSDNKLTDILSTKFQMPKDHPCDGIRFLLEGHKLNRDNRQEDINITRYFYGARHIFSILANWFDIEQIRYGYFFLSIIAPLSLWTAVLLRARSEFLVISPLIISILIGFGLGNLGGNIAHAPGYFIPILAVVGVVLNKEKLNDFKKRIFVYSLIAAATTYLDILHGPLPFILSLTIIINHMVYHSKRSADSCDFQWIVEAVDLILIFVLVAILLFMFKLVAAILVVKDNVFGEFYSALRVRTSDMTDLILITRSMLWEKLLLNRSVYFFDSIVGSTVYYVLAAVAWIFVTAILMHHLFKRIRPACWREITVLVIVSLGIVSWYFILFVNHTYVHAHFMGRLAIIPASAGAIALIYLGRSYRHNYFYRMLWFLGTLVTPVSTACVLAFPAWSLNEVEVVKNSNIDAVACSNDPLVHSDGIEDVVLRLRFPLALRLTVSRIADISLERTVPFGAYTQLPGNFPLGVLNEQRILLHKDRSNKFPVIATPAELLLAYCADGYENTESSYRLVIRTQDGVMTSEPFHPPLR